MAPALLALVIFYIHPTKQGSSVGVRRSLCGGKGDTDRSEYTFTGCLGGGVGLLIYKGCGQGLSQCLVEFRQVAL